MVADVPVAEFALWVVGLDEGAEVVARSDGGNPLDSRRKGPSIRTVAHKCNSICGFENDALYTEEMRDAIVLSGWTWEANNVPERMAQVIAKAGAKVLYVEVPVTFLRKSRRSPSTEVLAGITRLQPLFAAHRVFQVRMLSQLQTAWVKHQVVRAARRLKLKNPVCFFPHGEEQLLIASALKKAGYTLVHVEMDYELPASLPHVQVAETTLAIPEAVYRELHPRFPGRIFRLQQLFTPAARSTQTGASESVAAHLASIPRPYLLYLGAIQERIDRRIVAAVLSAHPEWHLVSFGSGDLHLPNHHVLPWVKNEELGVFLGPDAVGLLPYRLDEMKDLHCVPLKLFDYFAAGMAVVATPITYLAGHTGLVYLARTEQELEEAIEAAFHEPADSPIKMERRAFTEQHSIANHARWLAPLLEDTLSFPPPGWLARHFGAKEE